MKEEVKILKMLLEQPEEEKAPKTFEDNPMEFILRKYVSLNEVMIELMTESYREYLDAVFIVSPKPTSFKIVLHNGQYFYLTYMGPAYEASVAGKNYYLSNIGEKERCMLAISKLLRGGNPLKTKGPEGAEKEPSAEDSGETAGGLSATGGEEGETGAEEAPELTEVMLMEAILQKSISQKEVSKKKLDFYNSVLETIKDTYPEAKKSYKNGGLHIRVNIGDDKEAMDNIEKSLSYLEISPSDYTLETIAPGKSDARSRSYSTYKITLTKDVSDFKKGDTVLVVSTVAEGKTTLAWSSLSPNDLGLSTKSFMKAEDIVGFVNQKIKKYENEDLSNAISLLMKDVMKLGGEKYDDVSEITAYSESIPLSKDTIRAISALLPGDVDIVGKNFGEVLGAILMAKKVKLSTTGIHFSRPNEPLIDFSVDGYGISSKYKQGAAAALTEIVSKAKIGELNEFEKKLHGLLSKSYQQDKVSKGYLYLASKLEIPAIKTLASIMKTEIENITVESINDFIIKITRKAKSNEEKDAIIVSRLKSFFKAANSSPRMPISWETLASNNTYYGIIMYPLAFAVVTDMNNKYANQLKGIISKQEIKQLYLNFNLGSSTMTFELRSFSDPDATFKFKLKISVNEPDKSSIGFAMK